MYGGGNWIRINVYNPIYKGIFLIINKIILTILLTNK